MLRRWLGAGGIAIACAFGCSKGDESTTLTTAFDPSTLTADGTGSTAGETGSATTTIASADGTGPAPEGDCCEASSDPGCADPEIQTCVCTIEPACCQAAWAQSCVAQALDPCNAACEAPPATSTGPSTTGDTDEPPPMLSCDALAAQQSWENYRCEAGGGTQCNGMGTPTTDCDFCCELCGDPGDISCGTLSTNSGWAAANCEWNGNGACGGVGTPTCDCNFCCEVS